MIGTLKRELDLNQVKFSWLDANKHNKTIVANTINDIAFPLDKVFVGKSTYGPLKVYSYGNENEKLIIGNYCSISSGVLFILGGNHNLNMLSTFPFKYFFFNQIESNTKGPIVVEDDVWIGTNSIILSGVTLSKGTIVAAGSVVTKSFKPYSIIGGNPAKLIRFRFEDTIIDKIVKFDFEKLTENDILNKFDMLNEELSLDLANSILKNQDPE